MDKVPHNLKEEKTIQLKYSISAAISRSHLTLFFLPHAYQMILCYLFGFSSRFYSEDVKTTEFAIKYLVYLVNQSPRRFVSRNSSKRPMRSMGSKEDAMWTGEIKLLDLTNHSKWCEPKLHKWYLRIWYLSNMQPTWGCQPQ